MRNHFSRDWCVCVCFGFVGYILADGNLPLENDETCGLGHLDGDLTEMICNPNGHSLFEKLLSCSACLSFLNPSIFQQTSRLQGVHN